MNFFENIFRALNKAEVEYIAIGGVAVNLYGYRRFTGDIDILLLLEEKNLKKMDNVMKKMKYTQRLPISLMDLGDTKKVKNWIRTKNFKAYTFQPPYGNPLQIDIVIEESLKFKKIKKVIKTMGNLKIPVVSIDMLLLMKKKAKRDKDILDLHVLEYLVDL